MQACYIDRYGDADVVRVGELPTPRPGPGELLFRMQAASVNPVDNKTRAGRLQNRRTVFKVISGSTPKK